MFSQVDIKEKKVTVEELLGDEEISEMVEEIACIAWVLREIDGSEG